MGHKPLLLVGCGILQREIRLLIDRNGWPLETHFLDSSLHVDLEQLGKRLSAALHKYRQRECIVFYGACHPLMDTLLSQMHTRRTPGQNCVEILLGQALFTQELAAGAFFLLEEWSRRWEPIIRLTFGNNLELAREIFQGDRKYLLCLRTPCSADFTSEAEEAGRLVGLPLRWLDSTLDHLQAVLQETIERKRNERRGWR